jgi:hypothetical protein
MEDTAVVRHVLLFVSTKWKFDEHTEAHFSCISLAILLKSPLVLNTGVMGTFRSLFWHCSKHRLPSVGFNIAKELRPKCTDQTRAVIRPVRL